MLLVSTSLSNQSELWNLFMKKLTRDRVVRKRLLADFCDDWFRPTFLAEIRESALDVSRRIEQLIDHILLYPDRCGPMCAINNSANAGSSWIARARLPLIFARSWISSKRRQSPGATDPAKLPSPNKCEVPELRPRLPPAQKRMADPAALHFKTASAGSPCLKTI